MWGLPMEGRKYGTCSYLRSAFNDDHNEFLKDLPPHEESLVKRVEAWLERLPFTNMPEFNFWAEYSAAVDAMLKKNSLEIFG